jgi:hypothetical protein
VWLDTYVLKELFPRLFLPVADKIVTVAESGCWSGLSWKWNLCWSMTFLDREEGEVSMLQCWHITGYKYTRLRSLIVGRC